ncbi:hypothetical protein KDW_20640 [Dictyobacter vulcani]|uniref:FtsK domain-containing protein n=1 Tax=Dictyobacter vulcani TaxID=2607529 RepID=A0A5J4KLE0_9CHLR|nr:FtsK/SpoIIIE domain-containing protein [Dictyobacter vulcani]GER87902.1 hypothetical protein KDW_20640 [Dictyobacter vulcani]
MDIHIQPTPHLPMYQQQKPLKAADILIEQICQTYTANDARRDGIYYWPQPLPAPEVRILPDPLVLFQHESQPGTSSRQALVPLSIQEMLQQAPQEKQRPSMQIPLGLIDKPENQQQETLIVDLHGSGGALTGGPLLLLGTLNSGKGSALQTLLLWLTTRYRASQLICAIVDPNHDLDLFRTLPHVYDHAGNNLWTDGATDEEIVQLAQHCTDLLVQRRKRYNHQHWTDDTFSHLWTTGEDLPMLLLIVSQYQRFTERPIASQALKKLIFAIAEARSLGAYTVITAAESGMRHLPADLLNKISTRISLFINEQQRAEFFGRIYPMDPIPGRGLLVTQDRQAHHIQLALPVSGASETERYEQLKYAVQQIQQSQSKQ